MPESSGSASRRDVSAGKRRVAILSSRQTFATSRQRCYLAASAGYQARNPVVRRSKGAGHTIAAVNHAEFGKASHLCKRSTLAMVALARTRARAQLSGRHATLTRAAQSDRSLVHVFRGAGGCWQCRAHQLARRHHSRQLSPPRDLPARRWRSGEDGGGLQHRSPSVRRSGPRETPERSGRRHQRSADRRAGQSNREHPAQLRSDGVAHCRVHLADPPRRECHGWQRRHLRDGPKSGSTLRPGHRRSSGHIRGRRRHRRGQGGAS
jgi:hypothetical protein